MIQEIVPVGDMPRYGDKAEPLADQATVVRKSGQRSRQRTVCRDEQPGVMQGLDDLRDAQRRHGRATVTTVPRLTTEPAAGEDPPP